MSHTVHEPGGSATANSLQSAQSGGTDSLPRELLEHIHRLSLILPVISVSVMALQRQAAEADADIASVLSQHACEPLDSEIERIESLLSSRVWRSEHQEAHA